MLTTQKYTPKPRPSYDLQMKRATFDRESRVKPWLSLEEIGADMALRRERRAVSAHFDPLIHAAPVLITQDMLTARA